MARIYFQTIKKWAIKVGITGGTLVGLLFVYLFVIGAISNVSYSGDTVCAGTQLDPCYAFINFTANQDIFIYPIDYDPWGRDTPFSFDPNVKSWKLERSWGSGWREINLSKTCQYTWCGAPHNGMTDNKYSIAFRKGRTYQIRITGYKNSPNDTIKWGAFDGKIDPVWEGLEDIYSEKVNTGNVKFDNQNRMSSTFLNNSFFKIKYDLNKIPIRIGNKIVTSNNKMITNFYKIDNLRYNSTNVRYIDEGKINNFEMPLGYLVFKYIKSEPTIRSYIPSIGYVFYGNSYYYLNLNKINSSIPIIRYKTETEKLCPVILSNGKIIAIEYHQNNLSDKDIILFFNSMNNVLKKYGVDNIRNLKIRKDNLIYYFDGLNIMQVGRIAKDDDTIIFYLYLEPPSQEMINQMSFKERVKQDHFTSLGGLKNLNNSINYSIRNEIVEEFAKLEKINLYNGNWSRKEINIMDKLNKSLTSQDWLINASWNGIAEDYKVDGNKYEFEIILNKKPLKNNFSFDLEINGLNFYYQPFLTNKEREEGNYRPSNVEGSYAIYYDQNRKNGKYKTGKVGMIYRPKAIDNNSNWIWANISIDKLNKKMIISVDKDFLDNASYPVIIDPTLGYTTIGGSSMKDNLHINGNTYSGVNGNVSSMIIYISGAKSGDYETGGIYINNTISTLLNLTETIATPIDWQVFNFTKNPILNSSSSYIITMSIDSTDASIYYDILGSDLVGISNYSGSPGGYLSTIETNRINKTFSMYINYTSTSDTTPPTYSNNQTNNTIVGQSILFSILYNDDTALNPNGQYIFSTNNTGVWINDSAINFTSTPSWANITKTLNLTVGNFVGYRWYVNDSAGNINNTRIFTLTTTSSDTCTYTSGNWNIDCADNCSISSNVNMGGNNISLTGTGYFDIRADITNFDKVFIYGSCPINIYSGGFK